VNVIFTQIYFSSFLAGGEFSKKKDMEAVGREKLRGKNIPILDRLTELGFVIKTVRETWGGGGSGSSELIGYHTVYSSLSFNMNLMVRLVWLAQGSVPARLSAVRPGIQGQDRQLQAHNHQGIFLYLYCSFGGSGTDTGTQIL
jgi:hypothetical protein